MKITELMEDIDDNFSFDLAAACDLIGRARGNHDEAQNYRDFIEYLRGKRGAEYATRVHQAASKLYQDKPELDEYAVLGHEPTRNPKYLGPTEKVNSISVLNSPYGSAKEKTLSNKFFGGS